ncbi:MAG TPA: hypothetical protein VK658_13945 [Chryseolinea sp.]|nr:hypothetical protein [Chryseolinea sp.]
MLSKQPAWIKKLMSLGLSYREIQKLALRTSAMTNAQFIAFESDQEHPGVGEIIAVFRRQIDKNILEYTKFLLDADEELAQQF